MSAEQIFDIYKQLRPLITDTELLGPYRLANQLSKAVEADQDHHNIGLDRRVRRFEGYFPPNLVADASSKLDMAEVLRAEGNEKQARVHEAQAVLLISTFVLPPEAYEVTEAENLLYDYVKFSYDLRQFVADHTSSTEIMNNLDAIFLATEDYEREDMREVHGTPDKDLDRRIHADIENKGKELDLLREILQQIYWLSHQIRVWSDLNQKKVANTGFQADDEIEMANKKAGIFIELKKIHSSMLDVLVLREHMQSEKLGLKKRSNRKTR